ncbi:hypothetical protein PENTCL1PPCAC_28952, partial [Pristionchus entomophagus]
MDSVRIVLLFLLPIGTIALRCYTGTSFIRGQSVGTNPQTCDAGEYCFFAYAEVHALVTLKNAGCSKLRCMVSAQVRNRSHPLGVLFRFSLSAFSTFC